MRTAVFLAVLIAMATSLYAVGPRPETIRTLEGGPGGQRAELRYFSERPPIVDLPRMPATARATGDCRALALLVDFQDKPSDSERPPSFFANMLFGGAITTMRGFFLENSYGIFSLEGHVADWVRSRCPHGEFINRDGVLGTVDDYGLDVSPSAIQPSVCDYPLNIWGMVAMAVELADEDIDFSQYDNDGPDGVPDSGDDDGYVDALIIVHSGPGAETLGTLPNSVNYIWSMQSDLDYYSPTRNTVADGVRIGPFALVPEIGELGVYAHEFCHLLGLPDLYDADTGLPVVGRFCLMDEGVWNGPQFSAGSVPSHLSAPMKYFLGWISPEEVCLGCGGPETIEDAAIYPLGTSNSAYRLLGNPGGVDWSADGTGTGEYFMLENRQSNRGYYEAYVPATGLVIWKVDESRPDNKDLEMPLATIIQADGEVVDRDAPGMNIPDGPSDVWPGSLNKRDFTPTSDPSSSLSGGRFSGVSVEGIARNATGTVSADISVGLSTKGIVYAYPNPYRLTETLPLRIVFLPDPGPDQPLSFSVRIFNLEGDLVRVLESPGETTGNGTALWDARDETGRTVEPGVYFYAVESSGQEATGTIGIRK
jgi:immune inhibitor A